MKTEITLYFHKQIETEEELKDALINGEMCSFKCEAGSLSANGPCRDCYGFKVKITATIVEKPS